MVLYGFKIILFSNSPSPAELANALHATSSLTKICKTYLCYRADILDIMGNPQLLLDPQMLHTDTPQDGLTLLYQSNSCNILFW